MFQFDKRSFGIKASYYLLSIFIWCTVCTVTLATYGYDQCLVGLISCFDCQIKFSGRGLTVHES